MSRTRHNCSNCAHSGCCEYPCGGRYWEADDDGDGSADCDPWEGYDPDDERDAYAEEWLERHEP